MILRRSSSSLLLPPWEVRALVYDDVCFHLLNKWSLVSLILRWKLLSCVQCQEVSQKADLILIDCRNASIATADQESKPLFDPALDTDTTE